MRKLKYPIGISDFAEMRNNGYYYIDKTNLIVDLLDAPLYFCRTVHLDCPVFIWRDKR